MFMWALNKEVIVLLYVFLFSNGEFDAGVEIMSLDDCEDKVDWIYGRPPENYAKYEIRAIYAECLMMIPRPVKYEN